MEKLTFQYSPGSARIFSYVGSDWDVTDTFISDFITWSNAYDSHPNPPSVSESEGSEEESIERYFGIPFDEDAVYFN